MQSFNIIKIKIYCFLFLLYIIFDLMYEFMSEIDYYLNDNLSAIITFAIVAVTILFLWFFFYFGFIWAKYFLIGVLSFEILFKALYTFDNLAILESVVVYAIEAIISLLFLLILIRSKELAAYLHYKRPPASDEWLLKIDYMRCKKASVFYNVLFYLNSVTCLICFLLGSATSGLFLLLFIILFLLNLRMQRGYHTARIALCLIMQLLALLQLIEALDYVYDYSSVLFIMEGIFCSFLGLMPICSKKLRGHYFMKWIDRA